MTRQGRAMSFSPSPYSYGSAELLSDGSPAPAGAGGAAAYTEYASLARDVLFGKEAREEVAILEAKIENYRALAKSSSGIIRNFYLNEINKMEARLGPLKAQAGEAQFAADVSSATRMLTLGAIGVGVLVLMGLAVNQVQSARIKQAELRKLGG